jgi:hypothetical protein
LLGLLERPRALVDVAAGFPRLARLFHGGLGLEHLVAHAAQRAGVDVTRLALLLLLLCKLRLPAVLQVLERVEVPARHVLGVLDGDDVGARKGLVVDEVLPHLGLDVHALDRVPGEDVGVAAVPDGDNVRVVGEDLVRDGVDEVALAVAHADAQRVGLGVARKVEADQVLLVQGLGVDRVLARVLVEPGVNDLDVEDGAVGGADGVLEGLEGGGAEVEGEAAEGDLGLRGA